jgi:hypothetical protein
MKDGLEDFIRNNKDGFDHLEPDMKGWEQLNKKLDVQSGRNFSWMKIAASVAILFVLSATAYFFLKNDKQEVVAELKPQSQIAEVETYYTRLIEEKRGEISKYAVDDKRIMIEAELGLSKLDSMYNELKKEYKPESSQEVTDAMIQNLQLRIDILNQQKYILENIKKLKNGQKNENAQI